jgi:hypothetical protein
MHDVIVYGNKLHSIVSRKGREEERGEERREDFVCKKKFKKSIKRI